MAGRSLCVRSCPLLLREMPKRLLEECSHVSTLAGLSLTADHRMRSRGLVVQSEQEILHLLRQRSHRIVTDIQVLQRRQVDEFFPQGRQLVLTKMKPAQAPQLTNLRRYLAQPILCQIEISQLVEMADVAW